MDDSQSGRRWPGRAVAGMLLAAAVLAGCGSAPPRNEAASATSERLYREAREDTEAGAYERAIKAYERIEGLAAGTLLAQQAQLEVAYLQWRTEERASALATVDRFIKLNPSSPALDYAYYLKGLINFSDDLGLFGRLARQSPAERDQRAARDSFQAFKELTTRFPDSRYAPDARARMTYIVNSLANYEVHVARYYYSRGAYVAAINRAQNALADYRDVPALEEALFILMRSYDALGMAQLRDDTRRVLEKNYPQSPYLTGSGSGSDKPWYRFW